MTAADILAVREDPKKWFQGFGRYRSEETRQPTRGRANVLQRRVFEHYRRCQDEDRPCRMVVLKYRRAGSSTAGAALMYLHAHNYRARLGVIGTDYKASSNMLEMVKFYGQHDDFPGWTAPTVGKQETVGWEDYFGGEDLELVPFADRIDRQIATRIEFKHDSAVELYTSKNPESARSAGLNGYHATECARWKMGGVQDAGETLTSMRNTLPKRGFHVALEESTANGAQGAFYDTCRGARWPDYADWWKQWQGCWPLEESEFGKDLQFVFIFAAWFEDERHVEAITPDQERLIQSTLDDDEQDLIKLYQQDGPKGPRLGGEVNATVWEQLAWRRGIIKNVCTKDGANEFKVEYPSNPLEAFRASGSAVFNHEGLTAIEMAQRSALPPERGYLMRQPASGGLQWKPTAERESLFTVWERPIVGARYLAIVDPMSGESQVTKSGDRDRHSVLVLRDAFIDTARHYYPLKLVARIRPPCQWDNKPLGHQLALLSEFYGRCPVVVESNIGIALITTLRDDYHIPLYEQQDWDSTRQELRSRLGWRNDEQSRRLAISNGQDAVRQEKIEILCPHVLGEMRTFIFDTKGKAIGSGSNHDDDVLALCIGITCMPAATVYQEPVPVSVSLRARDQDRWKEI